MSVAWIGLLLGASALAGEPQGWRFDSSGNWPVTAAPVSWSAEQHVTWSTALPSWGNGSVVVSDGRVCVTSEPVMLHCLDAETGRLLWSADHPIVEAVEASERPAILASVAHMNQVEAQLAAARAEYGAALRAARTSGSPEASERVATLAAATDRLKRELDAAVDHRTPPSQSMVGWSSPTPATDGEAVYVLFASGVIAAHEADGRVRWARWLGPMLTPMIGWSEGHAASPVWVDGVLLVPFRRLTALDPATGAVVWEGEPWPHYGSPVPLKIDDTWAVVTPSGRIVRARDGRVLREGLGDVWYFNPIVHGDRVYLLEARADEVLRQQGGAELRAWRVDGLEGDQARATRLWTARVPVDDTFYAGPVVLGDHLHAVTHDGELWTVETATGRITGSVDLGDLHEPVYSSPAAAAGHLYVTGEGGKTVVLTGGSVPTVIGRGQVGPTRASPAFAHGRMYLRTADGVVAVESATSP